MTRLATLQSLQSPHSRLFAKFVKYRRHSWSTSSLGHSMKVFMAISKAQLCLGLDVLNAHFCVLFCVHRNLNHSFFPQAAYYRVLRGSDAAYGWNFV